jgi:cell division septation protein DedD
MTRTDEQEFVLGNRQLLSAFFVVVLLLGVFFAMGYVIGSNSKTENAAKKLASADAAPVPSSDTPRVPDVIPAPPPSVAETPPSRVETRPAVDARAAEEKPVRGTRPVDRTPPEKVEESPVKAPVPVVSTRGHTYLQVSAVKRPAADSIVKTLKDKGFPALLGESSKPELFRVLVGPYADTEALSKAKSDLKAMGFDAVVSK